MGDIEDAIKEHEETCKIMEQMSSVSTQMDDIHGLFFGTVDRPRNGIIMAVDKNTSFRTWMMKVVVSGGILTLIGAISKHLFF